MHKELKKEDDARDWDNTANPSKSASGRASSYLGEKRICTAASIQSLPPDCFYQLQLQSPVIFSRQTTKTAPAENPTARIAWSRSIPFRADEVKARVRFRWSTAVGFSFCSVVTASSWRLSFSERRSLLADSALLVAGFSLSRAQRRKRSVWLIAVRFVRCFHQDRLLNGQFNC